MFVYRSRKYSPLLANARSTNASDSGVAVPRAARSSLPSAAKAASKAASDGVGRGLLLRLLFFSAVFAANVGLFELFEVERDFFVPLVESLIVQAGVLRVERIDRTLLLEIGLFDGDRARRVQIGFVALLAVPRGSGRRHGALRFGLLTAFASGRDDVLARHPAAALQRGGFRTRARRRTAVLAQACATPRCGSFELALAEPEHERGREEYRVVAARADADEQREREVLQAVAAEREQRDQRDDDGRERVERTRHRLLDRFVDDHVVRRAGHE